MAEETVLEGRIIGKRDVRMRENTVLSEKEILKLVKKGDKEAYQSVVVRYMRPASSQSAGRFGYQPGSLHQGLPQIETV